MLVNKPAFLKGSRIKGLKVVPLNPNVFSQIYLVSEVCSSTSFVLELKTNVANK